MTALAPPPPAIRSHGCTHAGAVRPRNEDAFLERPQTGLWAVADGMGGHADGAGASGRVVEALAALPPQPSAPALLDGVRAALEAVDADLRIAAEARAGGDLSGSTVVALMIREGCFACLWAGDSRLLRLRAGRLERLTRDDSLVQDLVDAGVLTSAQARRDRRANILTRAVGCPDPLRLNFVEGPVAAGDVFLLCTDGLTNSLDEMELAGLLGRGADADALIRAALDRRASDNVTALLVET